MSIDTLFKAEDKPEVDRIATLIKESNETQVDIMQLVVQSVNLGITIGKGEIICEKQEV